MDRTLECDVRMIKMTAKQPASGNQPPIFRTAAELPTLSSTQKSAEICSRSHNLAPAVLGWTGHRKSVQSSSIPRAKPEAAIAHAILPRVIQCAQAIPKLQLRASRLCARRTGTGNREQVPRADADLVSARLPTTGLSQGSRNDARRHGELFDPPNNQLHRG
jgi:hypothetical protein